MGDPNECGRLFLFKKNFHPFKKNGVALRDDGFTASRKFSCHREELLDIPFEESLHKDFLMDSPILNVIEIVHNAFKRDPIESFQLILDGLQILNLFPKFPGEVEGFHIHRIFPV